MQLKDWADLATALSVIGVFAAVGVLFLTRRQLKQSARNTHAQLWLDLRKMFWHHEDVHFKFRPGKKYWMERHKKECYEKEEIWPCCDKEWTKVEAYIGLFEHCEGLLEKKLIDEDTFRNIYEYRVRNIVDNDKIVRYKLVDKYKYYLKFRALANRFDIFIPPESAFDWSYITKEALINKIDTIKKSKDEEIKKIEQDGWTPLMAAVISNDVTTEIIDILISKGANVNGENKDANTALMLATRKGYETIVEKLLEKGAEVNIQNKHGWTALMWAAVYNREAILKALLTKGAEVNVKGKDGKSALIQAKEKGHKRIIELLKQHDAKDSAFLLKRLLRNIRNFM